MRKSGIKRARERHRHRNQQDGYDYRLASEIELGERVSRHAVDHQLQRSDDSRDRERVAEPPAERMLLKQRDIVAEIDRVRDPVRRIAEERFCFLQRRRDDVEKWRQRYDDGDREHESCERSRGRRRLQGEARTPGLRHARSRKSQVCKAVSARTTTTSTKDSVAPKPGSEKVKRLR